MPINLLANSQQVLENLALHNFWELWLKADKENRRLIPTRRLHGDTWVLESVEVVDNKTGYSRMATSEEILAAMRQQHWRDSAKRMA